MSRINRCAAAFGVLILGTAIAIEFGTPTHAKAKIPYADDRKVSDEFFNNPENFSASNCDRGTWDLMHQAAQYIYSDNLPPSNIDDDLARARQIDQCAEKADKQRNQLILSLGKLSIDNRKEIEALGESRYSRPDAEAGARALLNIESTTTKQSLFLDWYMTQESILTLADNASRMFRNHAAETRYRNLVERYNALANSLANVRLAQGSSFPIQPLPLHCEASTNSATHVTEMNCQ